MAEVNANRFRNARDACVTPLQICEAQVKYGSSYRGSILETTKMSLNSWGFQSSTTMLHSI